ncbi:MAG: Competence protein-like protein [Herbinix sp.]|jgi:competence CoiA-like predicted nuclease|nr:Competence protein-like protein [Herbinix sp.]
MENCLLGGKLICTFDLKDRNGYYYEDLVLEWKQAAAQRHLRCVDCNQPVYLAAGPIKEPYFAHYDTLECDYGNGHESEELKKGKRLLYQLLKQSFPEREVQARYRMENGMYSTLFCKLNQEKSIAVDYRLRCNSLEKFQMRDSYYMENHTIPLYFLGIKQMKESEQLAWYQNLMQNTMGYCAFLNSEKESMVLKKSIGYRLGQDRRYKSCQKEYLLQELILNNDGTFLGDFQNECMKLEEEIKEEKERYLKEQQNLAKIKEQVLRAKQKEEERQSQYHRNKVIENAGLDPMLFEKCIKMVDEGNGHLVSKKYYDVIMQLNKYIEK